MGNLWARGIMPDELFSARERGFANDEPGKPTYVPTDEARKMVDAMAAYGIPQPQIAAVLGIHQETLRKHFRKELDTAYIKANSSVAQYLFENAKSGNVTAQIFWLKTRAGWKEPPQAHQHSGAVGTYDLSKLSEDELERLEAILSRTESPANPSGDPGGVGAQESGEGTE
jgi:hypothetical protein